MARATVSQAGGLRSKSSGPTITTSQLQSTCKVVSHQKVPLHPKVTVPGAQYYDSTRDRSQYGALGPQSKIADLMKVRDMPLHYTTVVTTSAAPLVIRSRTGDSTRLYSTPTTARIVVRSTRTTPSTTTGVTTSTSTSGTHSSRIRDESRNVATYMQWLQQYGGMGQPRYSLQAISTVPSSIASSTITIVSSSNFIPSTVKFLSTTQSTIQPVTSQTIPISSIGPASRVRKSVDLDESSSDSESTTKKPSTLLPLLKPVPARCIAPTSVVYSMLPQPGDTAEKPIVIEEGDNSSSSSEESYHSVRHVVVSAEAVGTTASGLSTGAIPSSSAFIPTTTDYTIRADAEELQQYLTQDVDMDDIVDQPMPEEIPDDQITDVVHDVPVSTVSYMYVDVLPAIITEPVSVPMEISSDDNNNNNMSNSIVASTTMPAGMTFVNSIIPTAPADEDLSTQIGGPPILGDLDEMLSRIDDALASACAITNVDSNAEADIPVSSGNVIITTSIPMELQPVLHVSTLGIINEQSESDNTSPMVQDLPGDDDSTLTWSHEVRTITLGSDTVITGENQDDEFCMRDSSGEKNA